MPASLIDELVLTFRDVLGPRLPDDKVLRCEDDGVIGREMGTFGKEGLTIVQPMRLVNTAFSDGSNEELFPSGLPASSCPSDACTSTDEIHFIKFCNWFKLWNLSISVRTCIRVRNLPRDVEHQHLLRSRFHPIPERIA